MALRQLQLYDISDYICLSDIRKIHLWWYGTEPPQAEPWLDLMFDIWTLSWERYFCLFVRVIRQLADCWTENWNISIFTGRDSSGSGLNYLSPLSRLIVTGTLSHFWENLSIGNHGFSFFSSLGKNYLTCKSFLQGGKLAEDTSAL